MEYLHRRQIFYCVENPTSSLLWTYRPMKAGNLLWLPVTRKAFLFHTMAFNIQRRTDPTGSCRAGDACPPEDAQAPRGNGTQCASWSFRCKNRETRLFSWTCAWCIGGWGCLQHSSLSGRESHCIPIAVSCKSLE